MVQRHTIDEDKVKALDNRILEVRVGSHLFGTSTLDSDLDYVGIFMPWDEILYGFAEREVVDLHKVSKDDTGRNTADAVDRTLHEYRKFTKLLMQNNPNIIHIVMANEGDIVFKDEHGFADRLFEMAPKFLHKGAHHRFVAYAHSQLHKMRIKPANYADLENGLGFLELMDDDRVLADAIHEQTRLGGGVFKDGGQGKHIKCGDLSFERGVFVKKAKRMIRERLSKASSRADMYTKHGYDLKFASNLIQMLFEGMELMNTGRIQMPLRYAHHIVDIKSGKYTADQIVQWAEDLTEDARRSFEKTDLPDEPPFDEIEKFVIEEVREWSVLKGGRL